MNCFNTKMPHLTAVPFSSAVQNKHPSRPVVNSSLFVSSLFPEEETPEASSATELVTQ